MTPALGFRNLHFIGLGGAGMSTLAEVMAGFGFTITGSDAKESEALAHLRTMGVKAYVGHAAFQVGEADAVIYSAAVPETNPEMEEARKRGLPRVRRAELLGRLTAGHRSVLVAGTHGKSTTTAMLGSIYRAAGIDATLIGGAAPRGEDKSAVAGASDTLIAEADEYDRAFLSLHPAIAVITNVDADHLDCYGTEAALHQAFGDFLNRLPLDGLAVLQAADPVLQKLQAALRARSVTFGLAESADYRAIQRTTSAQGMEGFTLALRGKVLGELAIAVPGEHNIQNALAAAAVALEENIPFSAVSAGLAGFSGVKRRLEKLGEAAGVIFFDDYAHHPTEVRASLSALRALVRGRLILVFQPHLYSRTAQHAEDFGSAVGLADKAFVTRIYPAREKPMPGVEGDCIVEAAKKNFIQADYLPDWENAVERLASDLKPGDLFVTMGAGDINRLGPALMEAMA